MRPQALFPLFAPTTSLPGVGPRIAALLERVAGPLVVDLLWHLPVGLIDRRFAPKIAEAPEGAMATLRVTVDSHQPPPRNRPRLPYKVRLPVQWARTIGKEPAFAESDIIVYSRICPHLGCIYNYVPNWREVTAGYGGYVPPDARKHALMACPCHLSIYDPADRDVPGRVLSGPAPRAPRTFLFRIDGTSIVVTDVEPGGIA